MWSSEFLVYLGSCLKIDFYPCLKDLPLCLFNFFSHCCLLIFFGGRKAESVHFQEVGCPLVASREHFSFLILNNLYTHETSVTLSFSVRWKMIRFFHFDKTADFINSLRIQAFPSPICKIIQNPHWLQSKNKHWLFMYYTIKPCT